MNPSIELRIEELVLRGFSPGDRHRIAEALRVELARRLADGGGPKTFPAVHLERLDAGDIHLQPGENSAAIGARAARAVVAALGQPASPRFAGARSH